MTPSVITAIGKLQHSKTIRVPYGFIENNTGNYECVYFIHNREKVVELKPLAMAMLLKEYDLIDSFLATTESIYLRFTPLDSKQETQLLDDFIYELSQFHSLLIVEEYEFRQRSKEEVATAFRLSCDKQQFQKVIN